MQKLIVVFALPVLLVSSVLIQNLNIPPFLTEYHNDLKQKQQKQVVVPDSIQNKYLGTYRLTIDKKRLMPILKKQNKLVAEVQKNVFVLLIPKSNSEYIMDGVKPNSTIKFVMEKGSVSKAVVTQNGNFEWQKVK